MVKGNAKEVPTKTIKNDTLHFFCFHDFSCQKILQFNYTEFTNCWDKYLEIDFIIGKKQYVGYLPETGGGHRVMHKQETLDNCRRIKK